MERDTIMDNEYATIFYYTDKGIIHHEWKRYCTGQIFRDILMEATAQLKARKGTKWLSDDRKYTRLTEEDSVWGGKVWFPATIQTGWRHWAMILPENNMGKINSSRLIAEYRVGGINAAIFDSVPEAMAWLEIQ